MTPVSGLLVEIQLASYERLTALNRTQFRSNYFRILIGSYYDVMIIIVIVIIIIIIIIILIIIIIIIIIIKLESYNTIIIYNIIIIEG